MSEEERERVKFNTEIIKLLGLFFIATGGGTISLILSGLPSAAYGVMAVAGMIFALTSGILAIFVYTQTKKLLK
jgi:hypothetical protein